MLCKSISSSRFFVLALRCVTLGAAVSEPALSTGTSRLPPLQAQVNAARQAGQVPALGAVEISCGHKPAVALQGVTRLGGTNPVTSRSRFNIGSNAKSMLASLAATFVQDGRLRWDTTVADVLGSSIRQIDPALGRATMAQLLSHRSGLPSYDTGAELNKVMVEGVTPAEQRLSFARQVLTGAPAYPLGDKFLYSNAGYVVAGVMLETIGGAPFEQLMQDRLFRPLGIHASFGSPVPPLHAQPWGHFAKEGKQQAYADPDPVIPPFLQPAGDVSLTLADYGRYLREHLCGLEGKPTRLLTAETVKSLHAPQGDDGAGMGWGSYELAGTQASVHVGGTGTFSSFVAIMPMRNLAVATVTNSSADEARTAALDLLQQLAAGRNAKTK